MRGILLLLPSLFLLLLPRLPPSLYIPALHGPDQHPAKTRISITTNIHTRGNSRHGGGHEPPTVPPHTRHHTYRWTPFGHTQALHNAAGVPYSTQSTPRRQTNSIDLPEERRPRRTSKETTAMLEGGGRGGGGGGGGAGGGVTGEAPCPTRRTILHASPHP